MEERQAGKRSGTPDTSVALPLGGSNQGQESKTRGACVRSIIVECARNSPQRMWRSRVNSPESALSSGACLDSTGFKGREYPASEKTGRAHPPPAIIACPLYLYIRHLKNILQTMDLHICIESNWLSEQHWNFVFSLPAGKIITRDEDLFPVQPWWEYARNPPKRIWWVRKNLSLKSPPMPQFIEPKLWRVPVVKTDKKVLLVKLLWSQQRKGQLNWLTICVFDNGLSYHCRYHLAGEPRRHDRELK